MSKASYNFTVTRSARLALALKREWSRDHSRFFASELHFTAEHVRTVHAAAATPERFLSEGDRDSAHWQQEWVEMHRGASASVQQGQVRMICYSLPVPVKYVKANARPKYAMAFLG